MGGDVGGDGGGGGKTGERIQLLLSNQNGKWLL